MVGVAILKAERLVKSFGRRRVLDCVSLEVFEGEVLALVGESGSGKTTLLRTLSGFYAPQAGSVTFRYSPLERADFAGVAKDSDFVSVFANPRFARVLFGFASQEPSFYEKLTVLENLTYFGGLYGLKGRALRSNAEILLELLDLKSVSGTLGFKLSGGMQRRLDIACALMHDPEVLILDEPTADLDPSLRAHFWSLIKKVNKRGTTIIIASHHLSEVEGVCSRIAVLRSGSVIDVDSPAGLKDRHGSEQTIFIHSYPGNYREVLQSVRLALPGATGRISPQGLVLKTRKPVQALISLLDILKEKREELIDVKVARPGLDELFSKLTKPR